MVHSQAIGDVTEGFANTLGIPVATLRNWEQNRVAMEPATIALMRILAREPEAALREANLKFERRFRSMEQSAGLEQMSLDEMDQLWREAKATLAGVPASAPEGERGG